MPTKNKNPSHKKTSIREYLHETGILESGDETLIRKVKQAYWKNYHKEYKREKRCKGMECVVVLDAAERAEFESEALKYQQTVGMLLKTLAQAYIRKRYISPDKRILQSIEQKLSAIYSEIEQMMERNNSDGQQTTMTLQKMLSYIESIECILREMELSPRSLEDEIKAALKHNPNYLTTFLQHQAKL